MLNLKTKTDLLRLVDEAIQESLTLDYKASPALSRDGKAPDELCKDVAALANSTGGQLIYGIEEDKITKKPSRVDDGVTDPKITREWIEQILNSRVQPRMHGIQIVQIDLQNGKFGYVITVPQSQTGPHQSPDQKYYRRFELQSVPMYDHEIKDVMRRATTPDLFVVVSMEKGNRHRLEFEPGDEISKPFCLYFNIANRSPQPAYHTVVEIGVDTDFILSHAISFEPRADADDEFGTPMRWFRWANASPPGLPIFQEHPMEVSPLQLLVDPSSVGINGVLDITVKISAPGFSSTEHWAVVHRAGVLTLHPPTSDFAARAAE
jgi:hypothetical protein